MLKDEVNELRDFVFHIESPVFQEYIMKPLYKELDDMKGAYSCESLKELARLKGKREGLEFIKHLIKVAQEAYQSKLEELNQQ